ncbi:substrate-binding domain-containing protein [Nocardioides sp. NPDC006273]|uniref:sugar ABC transporter substrate-binding protein n=1 Tax=Nocardioides sp. NPDC006273 TaxID=3155598 RepID=UPI0033B16843
MEKPVISNRSTRHAVALLAAAVLSLVAAACSGGDAASSGSNNDKIAIAAVLPNTSDPFWATISCGAEAKADELGAELTTYNSTSVDANTIASNFQAAQLSSPDGILVSPFNNNQFIGQYQSLMKKGVPIVTQTPTEPTSEYKAVFSSTDTAGLVQEVVDVIPDGAGTAVFLGGAPGIPPLEKRTQPFVDALLDARTDLAPLPTEYSGFDINKATTMVSALILAHPDLKVIIAADGPDGLGAAAAIRQAGKTGEIALIAFDAVPGEVDALREGTISALIAQNPTEIGARSIEVLVAYLESHRDDAAVTATAAAAIDNRVLTAGNVDDPDSEPYLYKTDC